MNVDKRPKEKTLSPNLLDLFYQILILCESDAINSLNITINDPKLKEFINNKDYKEKDKITLAYSSKSKKKKVDFNSALELNEIRFNNTKNNVIKSLFWHLRHAFAHNRLSFHDKKNHILYIENVSKGTTQMKAKVRVSNFKKFISFLLTK